jgi:hypothetical protein
MLGTTAGSAPAREGDLHIEEQIQALAGRLASVEADVSRVVNMLFAGGVYQEPRDER